MCRVIQPHAGIDGESRSFEFGNDGCLHRLFNWMRNAEDEKNDGNEAGEDDSHGDREAAKATEGNKTTMKAKKINFSPDSLAPWNWKFPRLKANQGEALAVTGQNPPPPSKGAKRGAARGRPPHNNHQPHSSPPSSRRPMPKLLHTLCCCIRPDNYNRKKNDSSNSTAADGCIDPRTSPISQISKGSGQPPSKSVPTQIAGELRQRLLVPRPETSKGLGLGQRTQLVLGIGQNNNNNSSQNGNNNNNNNLTILGGDKFGHVMHKEHHCLLPRVMSTDAHRKCLIVDLDETLVHSSFKPVKNADFVIPVEIDNVVHQVYVLKRPHTDHFLERIGSMFECVLFTASLAKYADPVADLLDKRRVFRNRLFREACVFFEGNYVKDLERLGRDLRKVVIIDNSPASYAFHPDNAIAVRTWFDDPNDTELLDLLPMLEELAQADDIYRVLGTVPPHQQPRCLTPSEDLIQPPPMASSSPITQVVQPSGQNNNNNGNGGSSQPQPWRKGQYSRMMDDKYRRNLESVPPSSKR